MKKCIKTENKYNLYYNYIYMPETYDKHKAFTDIVIIGSGIAGLYSAFLIQQMSPQTSFVILEKYKKQWIGGRLGNEMFCGTEIVTGAGVGRSKKDVLLMKLLKELHLPIEHGVLVPFYSSTIKRMDINKTMELLKGIYKTNPYKHPVTFKQFASRALGKEKYQTFIENIGYTDYENEDALQTLENYGMEDNACCLKIAHVPWKKLVLALVESIGGKNIKTSQEVVHIHKINETPELPFLVETAQGTQYICNKIIVATTIDGIREIIPGAQSKNSIYQEIHGQTFLRLYGKFTKPSTLIMKEYVKGYTIVSGPIQKIIPMDAEKGIYMISYSDNNNAMFLKKYLKNTTQNRSIICKLLELSLGIPSGSLHLITMKDYYWPIGTHYYSPLNIQKYKNRETFIWQAQHPDPNILVVGEVVSTNQGWTEGALESVQMVLTKKWILQ